VRRGHQLPRRPNAHPRKIEPVGAPAASDRANWQLGRSLKPREQPAFIGLPGHHAVRMIADGRPDDVHLRFRKRPKHGRQNLVDLDRPLDGVLIAATVVLAAEIVNPRKDLHAPLCFLGQLCPRRQLCPEVAPTRDQCAGPWSWLANRAKGRRDRRMLACVMGAPLPSHPPLPPRSWPPAAQPWHRASDGPSRSSRGCRGERACRRSTRENMRPDEVSSHR
jgi:hypothetical protein